MAEPLPTFIKLNYGLGVSAERLENIISRSRGNFLKVPAASQPQLRSAAFAAHQPGPEIPKVEALCIPFTEGKKKKMSMGIRREFLAVPHA
eukprot:1082105-Pelagomonas_calceolata.AAC.1